MKLDVVVPTYKRSSLLRKAVESLLRADVPAGLDVTIYVVDNNSRDDTRDLVLELQRSASLPIVYVHQHLQGLSHARNAGISAGSGEVVGLIDDDEEVHDQWLRVLAREFADPSVQFIAGPCLANCEVPMPAWLPPGYNGVIGVIAPKPRALMNAAFPGNLNGGNAAFRRQVFDEVGLYNPHLGRSGKGLLSDEDAELYRRILAAGLSGLHVPDFIIYHYIPADRLTRRYHRQWCFWRGVSQGLADVQHREPVPYFLGVPRYRIREALGGVLALPQNLSATTGSGPAFSRELALWTFFGFVYGRFFADVKKLYGTAP